MCLRQTSARLGPSGYMGAEVTIAPRLGGDRDELGITGLKRCGTAMHDKCLGLQSRCGTAINAERLGHVALPSRDVHVALLDWDMCCLHDGQIRLWWNDKKSTCSHTPCDARAMACRGRVSSGEEVTQASGDWGPRNKAARAGFTCAKIKQ